MSRSCCGFGHRFVYENIAGELYAVIEALVCQQGVNTFYTGGMGEFDKLFSDAVRRAKHTYPNVKLFLQMPYFTNKLNTDKAYYEEYFDGVLICEQSAAAHYKAAIPIRNRDMIDKSDFVITYVKRDFGGAYKAGKYAKSQNKRLIKIPCRENDFDLYKDI